MIKLTEVCIRDGMCKGKIPGHCQKTTFSLHGIDVTGISAITELSLFTKVNSTFHKKRKQN